MNKNSPFYIIQDFISPMMAEDIIDSLKFTAPDLDKDGNPLKSFFFDSDMDDVIFERVKPLISELEEHYGIEYVGTEPMTYEFSPQGFNNEEVHAENSLHLRGKWLRTKSRDLTGIIFLNNYNDKPPFEDDFEVYGGKLQFPQHKFSLNPERGTLVIFPSDPHFLNGITKVQIGDSVMIRFHITAKTPFLYDHANFEGDYTTWFEEFA